MLSVYFVEMLTLVLCDVLFGPRLMPAGGFGHFQIDLCSGDCGTPTIIHPSFYSFQLEKIVQLNELI